jgi:ABC-type antimicrobial peptide transport system permease subunit
LSNLRDENPRTFFLPFRQTDAPPGTATLVVRSIGNPALLLQPIQRLIDTSELPFVVQNGTTQQQVVDDSLRQERLLAQLSSVFGTLALLLACIGVFGIVSYTATRRTREFGLRRALGAGQTHLSWLMLRETMILVIAGVVTGVTVAFVVSGVLETLLYQLTPTDAVSMAAATLLVVLVAVVAGAIPARRASHVDPLSALRTE